MYADPNIPFWLGGRFNVDEARILEASGIGAVILGGGLAVGRLVRMIVKR